MMVQIRRERTRILKGSLPKKLIQKERRVRFDSGVINGGARQRTLGVIYGNGRRLGRTTSEKKGVSEAEGYISAFLFSRVALRRDFKRVKSAADTMKKHH
ncbi:hypothetical protein L1987_08570 [Smallanthus sonchifolius]|uniref:Uncharacterized protein n=1 Tax=Smallanthus sonchifolius TaxID=185202 RepID=A0ACB9JLI6_9ASTR|nr:hypothetical protein L1987_08570 [Smallanthus sonchifolius]